MVLIHFADPDVGQPLCGEPERVNWLWAASPDEVTCERCSDLVHRREPDRARDTTSVPGSPPVTR